MTWVTLALIDLPPNSGRGASSPPRVQRMATRSMRPTSESLCYASKKNDLTQLTPLVFFIMWMSIPLFRFFICLFENVSMNISLSLSGRPWVWCCTKTLSGTSSGRTSKTTTWSSTVRSILALAVCLWSGVKEQYYILLMCLCCRVL